MVTLRDKTYEESWLKEHDTTTRKPEAFRIDLKQTGVCMEDILKFNELLF